GAQTIALAPFRLIPETGLEYRLIFGSQRGLLSKADWFCRVPLILDVRTRRFQVFPLAFPIGIFHFPTRRQTTHAHREDGPKSTCYGQPTTRHSHHRLISIGRHGCARQGSSMRCFQKGGRYQKSGLSAWGTSESLLL